MTTTTETPAVPDELRQKIKIVHVYVKALTLDIERLAGMNRELFADYVTWLDEQVPHGTPGEDDRIREVDTATGYRAMHDDITTMLRAFGGVLDVEYPQRIRELRKPTQWLDDQNNDGQLIGVCCDCDWCANTSDLTEAVRLRAGHRLTHGLDPWDDDWTITTVGGVTQEQLDEADQEARRLGPIVQPADAPGAPS